MQKRDARWEGGRVGDAGEIVGLLHAGRGQQRKPGLTHGHHIRVVAENREGMGGQRAGGHVHAERDQLPGQFIHDRDHEQQPLRGGERRGERSALQHAVDGSSRARFGLHLHDFWNMAPEVGLPLACPFVRKFAHRGRRRDRVERDRFAEPVGDICRGFVSVHAPSCCPVLCLHRSISYANT